MGSVGDCMIGLNVQKFLGVVVIVALIIKVIDMLGDRLVSPEEHKAAGVTVAANQPASSKAPEKVIPIAVRLASANAKAGAKIFSKCKACHDMTPAKKNKIGPPLWDIVQADKGGAGGYSYSSAMSGMGSKWSYEDLDAFIASPRRFLKGTKMTFAGIKNAGDRANLIAFLRSLSPAPKAMPK